MKVDFNIDAEKQPPIIATGVLAGKSNALYTDFTI
jgi:hypothetical protein